MSDPIIDAHHHFWKYNDRDYVWMSSKMNSLRRDFLPADLKQLMAEEGVNGAVTVQARQTVEETEWLLGLAAASEFVRGVVGWVPLADPGVGDILDQFAGNPRLKAVRHVVHDEPDDLYILRKDFNRGVALLERHRLVYDVLIFERHLPQTIQFVDKHPRQVFVIDHVAKPRIKDRVISPWRENLRELAKRENVYCKVSGMVTEADWQAWTLDDLKPYFDLVLSAFEPQRLMFGSDWPVLTLAASYRRWVDTCNGLISTLSGAEQASIRGRTALKVYNL